MAEKWQEAALRKSSKGSSCWIVSQDFGAGINPLAIPRPKSERLALAVAESSIEVVGLPHFLEREVEENMMAIDIEYAEVVGLREVTHDH